MRLLALGNADHAETHEAFEALILLLQLRPHLIPADHRLILALAVSTIGADAS